MERIGLSQTLAAAERLLPLFRERTAGLSREDKGIRMSEMFFLFAAVADLAPARIVESGRARAQSTLVLSALFPEAQIISFESDADSPDVAVAAERLRERDNVELHFGDSRRLIPEMVRAGDVILIDGPKDFRAVKLALRLLRKSTPAAVFVHDLWLGSPTRNFLERTVHSTFFSDAPEWVRTFAVVDFKQGKVPEFPHHSPIVYGATMGCFPGGAENYGVRLLQCTLTRGVERLQINAHKFGERREPERPPDFTVLA